MLHFTLKLNDDFQKLRAMCFHSGNELRSQVPEYSMQWLVSLLYNLMCPQSIISHFNLLTRITQLIGDVRFEASSSVLCDWQQSSIICACHSRVQTPFISTTMMDAWKCVLCYQRPQSACTLSEETDVSQDNNQRSPGANMSQTWD